MNLLRLLGKTWPHILVFSLIIVFLQISPRVNDRYFVKQGKPIAVDVKLPLETKAARFSLDSLKAFNLQGVYQLSGWAFPMLSNSTPAGEYERQVVLQSFSGNYIFQADTSLRLDIQASFNHLDMDITRSGLSALIFKESIPQGTYRLGLIFKNNIDGSAYYVYLNRCVSRTPNRFFLEGTESRNCREVTHNDGLPVQINIPIPVEIYDAKFHIDNFAALDDRGIYQLSGWAFPVSDERIPNGEYECRIVLRSETGNFVYKTENITRVDVQNNFKDLGIDVTKSGIIAVISQEGLDIGSYNLGFIFKYVTNGNAYFFNTTRCITRNAKGLVLVETAPDACSFSSP